MRMPGQIKCEMPAKFMRIGGQIRCEIPAKFAANMHLAGLFFTFEFLFDDLAKQITDGAFGRTQMSHA